MKSSDIFYTLETIFPNSEGFDWDNNGPNFKFNEQDIDKCLIVLDINSNAIEYAIKHKIFFIISHHPVVFYDYETEILNPTKKELFEKIKKYKINCYAIHTNYDFSHLGMNYKILNFLKAKNIKLIDKDDVAHVGLLKGNLSIKEIADKLNNIIPMDYNQFIGDLNNKPKTIAICSGAGSSSIKNLSKIELYITGELKWSSANELKERKINTLILGHYMESFFIDDIFNILKNKLNNVNIIKYKEKNILELLCFNKGGKSA